MSSESKRPAPLCEDLIAPPGGTTLLGRTGAAAAAAANAAAANAAMKKPTLLAEPVQQFRTTTPIPTPQSAAAWCFTPIATPSPAARFSRCFSALDQQQPNRMLPAATSVATSFAAAAAAAKQSHLPENIVWTAPPPPPAVAAPSFVMGGGPSKKVSLEQALRPTMPMQPPPIPQQSSESDDEDSDADSDQEGAGQAIQRTDVPQPPPGARHPSLGSEGHSVGSCKRCCFFPRGRCMNGYDCMFCHYEHEKRKRKNKKKTKRVQPLSSFPRGGLLPGQMLHPAAAHQQMVLLSAPSAALSLHAVQQQQLQQQHQQQQAQLLHQQQQQQQQFRLGAAPAMPQAQTCYSFGGMPLQQQQQAHPLAQLSAMQGPSASAATAAHFAATAAASPYPGADLQAAASAAAAANGGGRCMMQQPHLLLAPQAHQGSQVIMLEPAFSTQQGDHRFQR